jgi:hypothetical protein
MTFFKNVFHSISNTNRQRVDWKQLAEVRRAKMEKMGLDTAYLDWNLYARVLEEKHRRLATVGDER